MMMGIQLLSNVVGHIVSTLWEDCEGRLASACPFLTRLAHKFGVVAKLDRGEALAGLTPFR